MNAELAGNITEMLEAALPWMLLVIALGVIGMICMALQRAGRSK